MGDWLLGMMLLALALFAWAALGHAMWLFVAFVFRSLFPSGGAVGVLCPTCGAQRGVIHGRCRKCGAADSRPGGAISEIHGTLRQLERLRQRGLLANEEFERLRHICQEDLDRLLGRETVPTFRGPAPAEAPIYIASVADESGIEIIDAEVIEPSGSSEKSESQVPREPVTVHPLDKPEPAFTPSPSPPPRMRRALADVLSAFMQERNIRWGELVSGLLIVGSAAGLVLSLRDQLTEWIPYFPAFLFLLGTAAIHGAGLYTLRRWNLQSTSRGVLTISMLLVPLNFLAAILISSEETQRLPVTSMTYLSAVLIGVLAFGAICYTGASALVGRRWPALMLAVLGPSLVQLAINRLLREASEPRVALVLGGLAAGAFVLAVLLLLSSSRHWRALSMKRARPLLMTLGLGGFSTLLPLALIVGHGESLRQTAANLSPVFAVLGAAVVAAGLFLVKRTSARRMVVLAVFGTALAILGGTMMAAAVAVAWPDPQRLIVVGTLAAALLTAQAFLGRLAILQVPVVACATLAAVMSFHWFQGNLSAHIDAPLGWQILQAWLMGRTALLLTGLVAGVAVYALALWRKWFDHALFLLGSAVGLSIASFSIAIFVGFLNGKDAALATVVFSVHAMLLSVAAISIAWNLEKEALSSLPRYISSSISVSAVLAWYLSLIHGLGFNDAIRSWLAARSFLPDRPVLLGTIGYACVISLMSAFLAWRSAGRRPRTEIVEPLALTSFWLTLPATLFAIAIVRQQFNLHAGYLMAIALVWYITAALHRWPLMWTGAQALSALAVGYCSLGVAQQQTWWAQCPHDVRTIAIVIAVLAVWSIAWTIARRVSERWLAIRSVIAPGWPGPDQAIAAGGVLLLLGGTVFAVSQGVRDELRLAGVDALAVDWNYLLALTHPLIWLAWGLCLLAMMAALWERLESIWIVWISALLVSPCGLLALTFQADDAVASATRWLLGGYLILVTGVLVVPASLWDVLSWRRWLRGDMPLATRGLVIGNALGFCVLPIVGLTLLACEGAARGIVPRGPAIGSFFANLGWTISYAVPLGAVVLSLVAIGLRVRRAEFLLCASATFQLLVSLGVAMPVLASGGAVDAELAVRLVQWNTIGLGVFALLWIAVDRWLDKLEQPFKLLHFQVALATIAVTCLGVAASWWIVARSPLQPSGAALAFGDWQSYAAIAAVLISTLCLVWRSSPPAISWSFTLTAVLSVPIVALTLTPRLPILPGMDYYLLLTGWMAVAGAQAAIACYDARQRSAPLIAMLLCGVVFVLTVFSEWRAPITEWNILLHLSILAVLLAIGSFRISDVYAFLSVPVASIAVSQWWMHTWPATNTAICDLASVNLLAVTLVCGWWLAIEIYHERTTIGPVSQRTRWPIFLPLTPVLTVLFCGSVALQLLVVAAWGDRVQPLTLASLVATGVLGAYLFALLWSDRQRSALPCLYVWGMATCVLMTVLIRPQVYQSVGVATALAAYLAMIGLLWRSGARLAGWGQALQIRNPVMGLERINRWLPSVTLIIALFVAIADVAFVLSHSELSARYLAGFGPVLLAIGILMQAQQQRRRHFLYLSALTATLAAVLLAWAELSPVTGTLIWLKRLIRLLVVLGSFEALWALALPRALRQRLEWPAVLQSMSLTCLAGAGASLVAILLLEAIGFRTGDPARLSHAEVGVVVVILGLLVTTLIWLAVAPKFSQGLETSERGRMLYVYAAQLVLALALGHLFLTRPQWFDGFLRPYWPYVVMTIAFAGVGLGEWFQRAKVRVLAEPFQRTSAFLPLLSAIGWWVEASRGAPTTEYASVMFVVGLLYVLIAINRQSIWSAAAAGVAGNVALWSLISKQGFEFAKHPQLWLIPPALSVLAAIEINRRRLREEQITAGRYGCMLVIYVSSTSEIFISGVTSVWPPLVLASLAVLGVLAGIALQIRAFLYLGASFVFLSMVTMVWHASKAFGQVWPWWVFGICVGLAMLALFGVFEKKRKEITSLVEKLRQWQH